MKGFRNQLSPQSVGMLVLSQSACALMLIAQVLFAQPAISQEPEQADETTQYAESEVRAGESLRAYLKLQFQLLDSPDFRTRELAGARIQKYPAAAIEFIAESAPTASINSTSQQISLLDHFLSHPDTSIKTDAYETLKRFSMTKTTAIAGLAASSVKAIEDDFERQAFEILTNAGADIGFLDININGSKRITRDELVGVEIRSDKFRGSDETLTWVRYLKSAKIVSLEGKYASPEVLALVAQMAGVKKILLRGTYVRPGVYETKLKPSDLLVLKSIPEIQHFEVKYMSIDDSFVPALCQLPITESLRLFGTAITEQGKKEIAIQLDGLEIYRGSGGFLGIGSEQVNAVRVTSVQENSAADNAGIELGDTILEIQGQPIKNFAALRATLANYAPNEMLLIKLRRPNPAFLIWQNRAQPNEPKPIESFEHQLFVVLNEQAN